MAVTRITVTSQKLGVGADVVTMAMQAASFVRGPLTYALTKLKFSKKGCAIKVYRRGTPRGCPLCEDKNQELCGYLEAG